MSIYFFLFGLAILFFIVRFFYKIERYNSTESNSNNLIDSAPNIEIISNSFIPKELIETFEHPIKMKNSFLNPNDDFGTLKKGVVIENLTYEYEVSDNDNSNFTILEPGDESKEISE
jgi:hypothetical protein